MHLVTHCYALGPPEELAPGYHDLDIPDGPVLCSIGPLKNLPLAILIKMPLMTQCYAL
jgi:hypothetical protein